MKKIYLVKQQVIIYLEVSPVSCPGAYKNAYKTTVTWEIVTFVSKLRITGVRKDQKGSGDNLVQFIHFTQQCKTSFQGPDEG